MTVPIAPLVAIGGHTQNALDHVRVKHWVMRSFTFRILWNAGLGLSMEPDTVLCR